MFVQTSPVRWRLAGTALAGLAAMITFSVPTGSVHAAEAIAAHKP